MIIEENDLLHYGIKRRSGRYEWGSGDNVQSMNNKDLLDYIKGLLHLGMKETDIAKGMGISTTDLRAVRSRARNEERAAKISQAQRLRNKGVSNVEGAKTMGLPNESSFRALLTAGDKSGTDALESTIQLLRKEVAEGTFVDVGVGVEHHIGVSNQRLKTAVAAMRQDGYELRYLEQQQAGTGKMTKMQVLAPPGSTWSEANDARKAAQIRTINQKSDDGGRTFFGIYPPRPISADRVSVNYAETGGKELDGLMYIRPGVSDVSIGDARYAQVRVQVGDSHFLKGMAIYKDDLPPGVDIQFNTNKSDAGDKLKAMKPLKDDPDNPFGAVIKAGGQKTNILPDGSVEVTSAMNILRDEGDWNDWSKSLSSQVLSKQSPKLARDQLNMTYEARKNEYDAIMALTNPTVKKELLEKFADGADSAAVQLKAAALPRQRTQVLIPVASLKDNEVYAPNFENGERVALIRYPHGGTFEIPDLVVNNRQPEAKSLIGPSAQDAIGLSASTANRMSGADFDGDTVLVIPNGPDKIKSTPALAQLKNFDPQAAYPKYDGMKPMTTAGTGLEMGNISNLITDMTIHKATPSELARAVKHSMVVIDAEKHELNYRQSAKDNNITALKAKYQGRPDGGASTLVSRATSQKRVDDFKERPMSEGGPVDKATGKRVYVPTGKTNYKTGAPIQKKVDKLADTDDAFTLVSGDTGTPIERVYAKHSNKLKSLANQARLDAQATPNLKASPSARKVYAKEVARLNAALVVALANAPLERQAQMLAGALVQQKRDAEPTMSKDEIKKAKWQSLTEARTRVGANKDQIAISPSEWEAIQAGAITHSKLTSILKNTDIELIKELATPRDAVLMTSAKTARAESLLAMGYTRADVAKQLGVSLTTLDNAS